MENKYPVQASGQHNQKAVIITRILAKPGQIQWLFKIDKIHPSFLKISKQSFFPLHFPHNRQGDFKIEPPAAMSDGKNRDDLVKKSWIQRVGCVIII